MLTYADNARTGVRNMRRRYRKLSAICAVLLLACTSLAQQEVMVSQYMFNGLFINPAYAGSHTYASSSLLHREQWLEVPGAPRTSMLAFDAPLYGNRMGLGLSVVRDEIGVSRDMEVAGHYAYRIKLGDGRLAFGLKAGLSIYSANLNDLVYWDENDAVYAQNVNNALVGKFGFGMYWNNKLSYIGISVPTLYAADKAIEVHGSDVTDGFFTNHFYLNAGKLFHLNANFDLKPSFLVKYELSAPIEADINCNVLYKERFWLGAGYRTGDAIVGMVEYQITQRLRAGYAYDLALNKLRAYTSGSHELMIGFDFGKETIKIKTPRYF
ncbi:MAG: type IX secretion system membrane protein PorP/SprF [Flavobacteriales bacterium]